MTRKILRLLRLVAYGAFAGVLVTSLAVAADLVELDSRPARRLALWSSLLAIALLLLLSLRARPARRWRRRLDLLAANLVATLVLVELVAIGWTRWFPSPLMWDDSEAAAAISANRLAPHASYFGFRANSLGYHDEEFFVAGEDDVVVALLADSFGVGTVPFERNFATIAERELAAGLAGGLGANRGRVAVHDFGVSSIGPAQYVFLADHEVERYRPRAVVVCLFVGNDITGDPARVRGPRPYALQGWVSFRLGGRLLRLLGARETVDRLAAIGRDEAGAVREPPWIADPALEPPTFSEAEYLRIESERAAVTDPGAPPATRAFERLFAAFDYLHGRLGERLGIVLIPDEFQVDDALWQAVLANRPDSQRCDRLSPQQRILAHCAGRGIDALDLTPALRAAAAGGVRVYHRRDTHWNAAGNEVAGRELGRWLLARLRPR